jgi:uncharacterized Zn-binding protein involved in type VI secretion
MRDYVRLGDATSHGGVVITASTNLRILGRPVARKGDLVTCPLHPTIEPNMILEGDTSLQDEGRPVARHGHHTTCGCTLISSLS